MLFEKEMKDYVKGVKDGTLRGPLYEMSPENQLGAVTFMWPETNHAVRAFRLICMYRESGENSKNTLEAFRRIVTCLSKKEMRWLREKLEE